MPVSLPLADSTQATYRPAIGYRVFLAVVVVPVVAAAGYG